MEMSKMASIDCPFEYFVGLQGFSFLIHDMRIWIFQLYTYNIFCKKNFPTTHISTLFILFGHLNAAHYFPLELGIPFSL